MGTTTTPSRRPKITTTTTTTSSSSSTTQQTNNSPTPHSNGVSSSPSPRRKSTSSLLSPSSSSKPTTTTTTRRSISHSNPIKNSSSSSSSSNTKSSIPPTTTTRRRDQHADAAVDSITTNQELISNMQSELLSLKTQLQEAQSTNLYLQSQNSNLSRQLEAANSKISSLISLTTTTHQENESVLELKRQVFSKGDNTKTCITKTQLSQQSIAGSTTLVAPPSAPPPPPPPLPRRPAAKAVSSQKASAVVELYQSLVTKRGNGHPSVQETSNKTSNAHNSIVDEIQNRSAHLIAIKKDIETKGDFISGLIQKVLAADYADIEEVLYFVGWLDKQLSLLADEQAVLKHFKWPEKKADSMREAAIEYRNLKLLDEEVSSYRDDTEVSCGVALNKMTRLLDKSERSLQRLIQLRSSAMLSYRSHKIPTDWMLDAGIISKIKQSCINLAKNFVKRITLQLESMHYSERESTHQEAFLLQGVNFAYRAHQFCGGLDSETLRALQEMRERVPGHQLLALQGNRQLFAAVGSA